MKRLSDLATVIKDHESRLNVFGKALSIGILNQVVSSGTNFALGIYLVRSFSPTDFGWYGIGFSIILFYAGIGNALFLTQMVVHVPDKEPEDKLPFAARVLIVLIVGCLITATIVWLFFFIGGIWADWFVQYSELGLSIVGASIAYLAKDFFIRHAYVVRKEIWALAINIMIAFSLIVSMLLQHYFLDSLSPVIVFWIFMACNMLGVFLGFILANLPVSAVRVTQLVEDVRVIWPSGKWALGGVSLSWVQTQAYIYVTAVFIGPAGVGAANAARLFITPAIFLVPAINQILMPRLAGMRNNNHARMMGIGKIFTIILVIFAVIYSVSIFSFIDELAPVLIGHQYEQISMLVAAWSLVLVFQFSRVGSAMILQVMKEFRLLTLKNIISTLATIITAVALMSMIGVCGAILGVAIGELVLSLLLYQTIKRKYYSSI